MGFMGLKPKHFLRCVGLDRSHKVTTAHLPLCSCSRRMAPVSSLPMSSSAERTAARTGDGFQS